MTFHSRAIALNKKESQGLPSADHTPLRTLYHEKT